LVKIKAWRSYSLYVSPFRNGDKLLTREIMVPIHKKLAALWVLYILHMTPLITVNNISTAHINALYYANKQGYCFLTHCNTKMHFFVFSQRKVPSPHRPTLETFFKNLSTFHFFPNLMSIQYKEKQEGIHFLWDITVCRMVDR